MSATALSNAVGRSRTYVGIWERDGSVVPRRDVLLRVVEALKPSEDDRRELLRLADLRGAPDTAKHLYGSTVNADPERNLMQALLERQHDWPSEPTNPNPRAERAQRMLDAAGWIIARVAAHNTDALKPFEELRWPQPLVDLGIVPDVAPGSASSIPDTLIEEEMPFVHDLAAPVTTKDVYTQSHAMACVYRRLLFADIERTRAAVSIVRRWAYDRTQYFFPCLSITFDRDDLEKRFGFEDLTCDTVTAIARRELALYLWLMGNKLPVDKPPAQWVTVATGRDYDALNALWTVQAKRYRSYEVSAWIRDAYYVVCSPTWLAVARELRAKTGRPYGSMPDMEARLRDEPLAPASELMDDMRHFATVPQELLEARLRTALAFVPPGGATIGDKGGIPSGDPHSDLKRRVTAAQKAPTRARRATGKKASKKKVRRKGGKR